MRKAEKRDSDRIMELLHQVNDIHAAGRPDLFISGCTKYTKSELDSLYSNPQKPVFVATDSEDRVVGYCFCIIEDHSESNNLRPVISLYIDDLCVDENERGKHIGKMLYGYVVDYARRNGFHNITLNVWNCNPSAMKFYEKMGLHPLKICMEKILTNN